MARPSPLGLTTYTTAKQGFGFRFAMCPCQSRTVQFAPAAPTRARLCLVGSELASPLSPWMDSLFSRCCAPTWHTQQLRFPSGDLAQGAASPGGHRCLQLSLASRSRFRSMLKAETSRTWSSKLMAAMKFSERQSNQTSTTSADSLMFDSLEVAAFSGGMRVTQFDMIRNRSTPHLPSTR